jgi:hypothetical protein
VRSERELEKVDVPMEVHAEDGTEGAQGCAEAATPERNCRGAGELGRCGDGNGVRFDHALEDTREHTRRGGTSRSCCYPRFTCFSATTHNAYHEERERAGQTPQETKNQRNGRTRRTTEHLVGGAEKHDLDGRNVKARKRVEEEDAARTSPATPTETAPPGQDPPTPSCWNPRWVWSHPAGGTSPFRKK